MSATAPTDLTPTGRRRPNFALLDEQKSIYLDVIEDLKFANTGYKEAAEVALRERNDWRTQALAMVIKANTWRKWALYGWPIPMVVGAFLDAAIRAWLA